MEMLRDELEGIARRLGVRSDVLEKVVRLLDVLRRVHEDEEIREAYALKGGTALNIYWLPLPRLSVDIDLNFTGDVERDGLAVRRLVFEQHVTRACRLVGCRVVRSPSKHAGGKFRMRFSSVFGGEQNLELDISYVARVPLFGLVERRPVLEGMGESPVRTYTLPELAAGKFIALLSRTVARDRFDSLRLLELDPDLLERTDFRVAFTCSAAASREDARKFATELPLLDGQEVRNKLIPVLREAREPRPGDAVGLANHLAKELADVPQRLTRWTNEERAFLDSLLDHGELRPELLTADMDLQARIAAQPMLRWKQRNVRDHRGLPPFGSA